LNFFIFSNGCHLGFRGWGV